MHNWSFNSGTPKYSITHGDVFTFVSKPYLFHTCKGKFVPEEIFLNNPIAIQSDPSTTECFCVYIRIEGNKTGLVNIIEVPAIAMDLVNVCFDEVGKGNMQTIRWKYIKLHDAVCIVPWLFNQEPLPEALNFEPIKKYLGSREQFSMMDLDVPPNPCREISVDNRSIAVDTELFDFNETDSYSWVHS